MTAATTERIQATRSSTCPSCGKTIHQDEWIVPMKKPGLQRFRWKHEDCRAAAQAAKLRKPVTPAPAPAAEPAQSTLTGDQFSLLVTTIAKMGDKLAKDLKAVEESLHGQILAEADRTLDVVTDLQVQINQLKQGATAAPKTKPVDGVKHPAFERVLKLAQAGINVMLVGPTGCGKSHLAGQVAQALGYELKSISCTAGMSEGQLTGRLIPTGKGGKFQFASTDFIRCYEEGGVFLLDEMDACDPNVMLVVNQALANGHLPLPNRIENPSAKKHENFVLICAANTWGRGADRQFVGRNRLDESTLDRFRAGQTTVDYSEDLERELLSDEGLRGKLWQIREAIFKNRMERVVSTRFFAECTKLLEAGFCGQDCLDQLTMGWTDDEKARVGL